MAYALVFTCFAAVMDSFLLSRKYLCLIKGVKEGKVLLSLNRSS